MDISRSEALDLIQKRAAACSDEELTELLAAAGITYFTDEYVVGREPHDDDGEERELYERLKRKFE